MKTTYLCPMYRDIEKSKEVEEFLEEDRKATDRLFDKDYQHHANYSYNEDLSFVDAETLFPGESPERVLMRKEAWKAFYELLAAEDEVRLRRLKLYFDAGLTYEQIAQREQVTEAAVRHQIERTLKGMREKLTAAGYSFADFSRKGDFCPFKLPTKRTIRKMEAAALEQRAKEVA